VLAAAENDLYAKLDRLGGCQQKVVGVSEEIETWLELAKGRIHDLGWGQGERVIRIE